MGMVKKSFSQLMIAIYCFSNSEGFVCDISRLKNSILTNVGGDVEKRELLHTSLGMQISMAILKNSVEWRFMKSACQRITCMPMLIMATFFAIAKI
jgi:hypothetical protein